MSLWLLRVALFHVPCSESKDCSLQSEAMISLTGCPISDAVLALWSGRSLALGVCRAPCAKRAFTLQEMKQLLQLHDLAPVVLWQSGAPSTS